jgi:hypothetical protein
LGAIIGERSKVSGSYRGRRDRRENGEVGGRGKGVRERERI